MRDITILGAATAVLLSITCQLGATSGAAAVTSSGTVPPAPIGSTPAVTLDHAGAMATHAVATAPMKGIQRTVLRGPTRNGLHPSPRPLFDTASMAPVIIKNAACDSLLCPTYVLIGIGF